MTGYADYLFLLSPPQEVKLEIDRYKRASARLIDQYASMNSPAHISLAQVERQKPFFADSTIQRMEVGFNTIPPVQLYIDGFKYFTHLHDKHTIYAAIRITPAVDEWLISIRKVLGIKKAIVPHITVVRNISVEHFNTLWPHFRHKQLVMPFFVSEIKVVKRETFANQPKWEAYKRFRFGGKIMTVVNNLK